MGVAHGLQIRQGTKRFRTESSGQCSSTSRSPLTSSSNVLVGQGMTRGSADAGIGLLKPPYPEMFVEWDQGAISPSSTPLRYGCYLSEHVGSGVLESGRRPAFIATIVNADLMAYQVAMAVALDDDGHFADWNLLWDDDYSPDEDDDAYTRLLVHNVIMALGLINCRNVETKETGRITVRP